MSSFVNVAGRKVEPEEVAGALRGFPGVIDASVIGIADEQRGEQLAACLAIAGPRPRSLHYGRTAARTWRPTDSTVFVFTDRLPRTPRGKIDTTALRNLVQQQMSAEDML